MRIEKIEANLAKAERAYYDWRKAVEVYERCKNEPLGEFPESAFRAYIVMGTVADAAKALNAAGQRNGKKSFQSNDISATITSVSLEDTDIMVAARFLLNEGRVYMDKLHN